MPWTPNDMITKERVLKAARTFFSDDEHYSDCRQEAGRLGEPCRVCAQENAIWVRRVREVRACLLTVFGRTDTIETEPDWLNDTSTWK